MTEPRMGFPGVGQVFQVQVGRREKEMEPQPFAKNSGPKTLDLNKGLGHGFVGEEEGVETGAV